MDKISSYIVAKDDIVLAFQELEKKAEQNIAMRFYSISLTTKEMAKILQVSERTICRYAEKGLIPTMERTSSKGNYRFRMSDAILLDIDQLKKTI